MKTATLFTVAALSLLAALLMRRQRNQALTIAEDSLATTDVALKCLQDANATISDLRAAVPVWFMAGAPMVEVYPTADDFCLN